jgi:hypothetical protein
MGEGSAETVKKIEEIRGRLEDEIQELETRFPRTPPGTMRAVGIAGAGLAATWLWLRLRQRRNRKRETTQQLADAVVSRLPDPVASRVSSALEDGQWKGLALGLGAAWFLRRRLAERRQVRIIRRALGRDLD